MFRHRLLSMVILAGLLAAQTVPLAKAATLCDSAQFVSDLTIPDGSAFAPGATFTKTWRLLNNGTCTWTTYYKLVPAGGDSLSAPASVKLPVSVTPGKMLDISVNLKAPAAAGHYKALFKLSNASGTQFGIGDSAADPFWVDINVVDVSAVIYDFVANAPYAQWKSGAGTLPFPGASGDFRGYSLQVNAPHLEDDSYDTSAGLLTVPQNKYNGYIQATYPEFQVQAGDRLQTLVNCEFGATSCYVTFRIDYLLPNNVQKTLWTWKESYDKRFYRADLDLSSLAGQKVRFVFMLLSSGFASGDRAMWGSPRILRTGTVQPPSFPPTLTPLPPLTPTATPLVPPPPTLQPAGCDKASFVTDVTVQDGTIFAPGSTFTKTWRLKNAGACVWTTAYKLIYYSGEQMGAPTSVNLPWGAAFGQTVDISVNMVAPSRAGEYRGYWILVNANGQYFGIGSDASKPIWVDINVAGESPENTAYYDFLANACSAEWKSSVGTLPCPGTNGDARGFVLSLNPAKLEDGSTNEAGLLTFPQNRYNGYIQGYYPAFTVQPGDRFKSGVSCEFGTSCYVTFRLDYKTATGYVGTFWQWRELSDGKPHTADVDLTPLAGRSVRFILTLLATGSATNDRAVWAAPRIVRAGAPTLTPAPSQWLNYANPTYGFQFDYPPQSQIVSQTNSSIKLNLPFVPGTNLHQKYVEAVVTENVNPCRSPLAASGAQSSETVVINGISFLKEAAVEGAAGNFYDWVAYSTARGNACISMDFMLHGIAAGNTVPPLPEYDKAAESAVFLQIMNTFGWLPATSTPVATVTPGSMPVVTAPDIRKLFMINGSNGWATTSSSVLLTRDGGATWYNATSAGGIGSVVSGFFPNLNTGWVVTNLSVMNTGSLYRTTDGGVTWTHFDVPFNTGYLQFLDSSNGFVLAGLPDGMQKHAVQLYQTTDGGATWTLKYANDPSQPNNTLPFSGHKNGMTFRDTSTGWVGGDIPTPGFVYLYKTTDGGLTWAQQSLALPPGYESAGITTTGPTFFGLNDAVLPVWMTATSGRDLFIYTSHDGGATWSRSAGSAPNSFWMDFASMQDAFSWDPAGFFRVTNDAGATWRVPSNVNFAHSVRDVEFISATTGWVVGVDVNANTALYRTNDGSATWTLLFTNIPTAAPQLLPDLTITELRYELQNTSCYIPGDPFGLRVWIKNNGNSIASKFVTRVNDAEQTVNMLGIGETTILFFPGAGNPVTVTVDATGLVAESDETNNSRSEMVPIPTLPLPCATPTSTPTPAPAALIGPYAVIGVAPNDVLNIRSGAGISQPVVGSFAPDAVNVMRTGPTANADNATWAEVQNPTGGTGWVNAYYLSEYVSHDSFCADTRIAALLEQIKGSMNQSNGDMFAGTVSPVHGVNVNLWAYQPAVHFSTSSAKTVFTGTEVYNWGFGPRGGTDPDMGTFAQIIQPKMQDVFNAPNMETYCDNLTKVFNLATPWPYTNIHYYNLYKPGTPGTDLDFRTWLIGFEYIDGQPYLYSMVTIQWEP